MKNRQFLILEHFYTQHGDCKCFFELKDGTACQGWISRMEPLNLRFMDSGPLAGDEDILININQIAVETLAYWDEFLNRWVDFQPKK